MAPAELQRERHGRCACILNQWRGLPGWQPLNYLSGGSVQKAVYMKRVSQIAEHDLGLSKHGA